jgi:hypothetical protein
VPLPALAALVVFAVAIVSGGAFAGVRGLQAWRALRRLRRRVGAGMVEINRGIAGVEARIANAEQGAAELGRATARLQESREVLAVLTAAAGDARGALRVLPLLRR